MPPQPRTYPTKFDPGPAVAESLAAYARVFSEAMCTAYRALGRAARTGQPLGQAQRKLDPAHRFGLTSRQAGSVLAGAKVRRAAQLELQALNLEDAWAGLVRHAPKQLDEHREGLTRRLLAKKASKVRNTLLHANTKAQALTARIAWPEPLVDAGQTSMTFGTKKCAALSGELDQALKASPLERSAALGSIRPNCRGGTRCPPPPPK
jgi:hypothetical protein